MAVLSVDLAYRSWADLGTVILDRSSAHAAAGNSHQTLVSCEVVPWTSLATATGQPQAGEAIDPLDLANRLHTLCQARNIRVILLDGPQAWKSKFNELEFTRVSERALNCAAKTGLPGEVRPRTYTRFAEFSIAVFNALTLLGWNRLSTGRSPGDKPERVLVECYPHAAWKSLGLRPLPSKRRSGLRDMVDAWESLNSVIPAQANERLSHDQLQAIVGGLPGLALEEGDPAGYRIVGRPPHLEDGHWREGFIVLPMPPSHAPKIRWLE